MFSENRIIIWLLIIILAEFFVCGMVIVVKSLRLRKFTAELWQSAVFSHFTHQTSDSQHCYKDFRKCTTDLYFPNTSNLF